MKKTFILVITLFFVFLINTTSVNASNHLDNVQLIDEEKMHDDVLYQYYNMDTAFDANQVKTTRDVYTYTINQSNDAFLATWTMSNRDGYKFGTLTQIAKDYEESHPGYIVLGGINAEGYYNGELTNAFVQDGDVIRKDVSYESFKELIGFKEDGSVVIKQLPVSSDYLRLKTNGKSFDIKNTNTLPEDDGIAILTPDLSNTLSLEGYNVYQCGYTIFRKSTQFPDSRGTLSGPNLGMFLKGSIIQKLDLSTISQVPKGIFYIVTKNEEVSDNMIEDNDIKCQFDYIDEYSDVRSMTGYMYKYLENGEVIPTSYVDITDVGQQVVYDCAYYKSTSKERAGIGFKEDGSIVLLTTNTHRAGPTQYEVGEMFKELGCINAYQFDGGGSVSFVKRDELGDIEMLNTPGDGSPRSIMSGLFIVTRDPGFTSFKRYSTSTSVTFDRKFGEVFDRMKNVSITIDGKTKIVEDGQNKVKIDGLEPNKKYEAIIKYNLDGKDCTTKMECQTKEYDPNLKVISTSDGFKINCNSSDQVLQVETIDFLVDDIYSYQMVGNNELVIDGLYKDTTYNISYICNVIDSTNNKKYSIAFDAVEYKTLAYNAPIINKFEESKKTENSLRISYEYKDADNIVKNAYLCVNNEKIALTNKIGRYTVENLNFKTTTYEIYLLLEFEYDNNILTIISNKLTYEKEECNHVYDNECDIDCNLCGEFKEIIPSHDLVIDKKIEPTCDKTGLTEGFHCTRCDYKEEQTEIKALGHDLVIDKKIEPTCNKTGLTEGCHCTRCDYKEEQIEIKALGHSFVDATKDKPKTCTICGVTEGTPLKSGCNKCSSNIILYFSALVILVYIFRRKR